MVRVTVDPVSRKTACAIQCNTPGCPSQDICHLPNIKSIISTSISMIALLMIQTLDLTLICSCFTVFDIKCFLLKSQHLLNGYVNLQINNG